MKNRETFRSPADKHRPTFFLVGLVLALLGVYGLFNMRFQANQSFVLDKPTTDKIPEEFPMRTFREKPKVVEKQKANKKEKQLLLDDLFKIVGNDIYTNNDDSLFALDDINDNFRQPEVIEGPIMMELLDKKPIFPGCEDILDEKERFDCFQYHVQKFVANNIKVCNGPFGVVAEKVYASFAIDVQGNIVDIEIARGEDVCNINSVKNVLTKLPQMQPGQYRGQAVKTRFAIPINITSR